MRWVLALVMVAGCTASDRRRTSTRATCSGATATISSL